jgi:hypothetical protein
LIIQHGTPATTGGASTSLAAAIPSDTTTGDLLLAFVYWVSFGGAITPPSGWTTIRTDQNLSGRYESCGLYYRFQQAGDSTFTWSTSGAGDNSVAITIVGYSGVNVSTPIDAGSITGAGIAVGSSGTTTIGTFTTVNAGDMLVLFYGFESFQADTLTGPGGWTRLLTNSLSHSIYTSLWQLSQSSAGAIGSLSIVDSTDTLPGVGMELAALVPAATVIQGQRGPALVFNAVVNRAMAFNTPTDRIVVADASLDKRKVFQDSKV